MTNKELKLLMVALLRWGVWTLPPASAFLLAVGVWAGAHPRRYHHSPEHTIFTEQWRRSMTVQEADWVLAGDSSVLIGVDAVSLSRELAGQRVENFGLFGSAGPKVFARLLENLKKRRVRVGALVVLLNPTVLGHDETRITGRGLEYFMSHGVYPPETNPFTAARMKLFNDFLGPYLPLPGLYGSRYGQAAGLAAAMARGHGSLTDPNDQGRWQGFSGSVALSIHPAIRRRLPALNRAMHRLTRKVYFGFTPLPEGVRAGDDRQWERFRQACLKRLGLTPDQFLHLPRALPDDWFATRNHLNEQARQRFTKLLAREIKRKH